MVRRTLSAEEARAWARVAATVKGGISDSFTWVSFEAGVTGDGAVDRTGAGAETEATSLV